MVVKPAHGTHGTHKGTHKEHTQGLETVLLNEVADGDGVAQVFGRVGHQRAGQRHRVDHGVQAPAQLEGQRVARPRRLRLTVDEVRPASLLVATSVWTKQAVRGQGVGTTRCTDAWSWAQVSRASVSPTSTTKSVG